ncbi:MAG: class I SAM-dependent methyltransferase [Mucilaginibacter sp.]
MEKNTTNPSTARDYSSISPSAYSLVLVKGLTKIPFMRRAAEQMLKPQPYVPDFTINDFAFWARVVHFESRYWSIDQLLTDIPAKNILELSSGFSFRGLARVQQSGTHYIDTDLPEVIADKKRFLPLLEAGEPASGSKLETIPLNALDEKQFMEIVKLFPADEPVVIVNEGLLMYLSIPEKEKLLKIIHTILTKRGGYWITADIYINRGPVPESLRRSDRLAKFFEQHKVHEQMFDSFEAAEQLFTKAGFVIDKQAETDYTQITAVGPMMNSANEEQLALIRKGGRIQATWRLRVS